MDIALSDNLAKFAKTVENPEIVVLGNQGTLNAAKNILTQGVGQKNLIIFKR